MAGHLPPGMSDTSGAGSPSKKYWWADMFDIPFVFIAISNENELTYFIDCSILCSVLVAIKVGHSC